MVKLKLNQLYYPLSFIPNQHNTTQSIFNQFDVTVICFCRLIFIMKLLYLPMLIVLYLVPAVPIADPIDKIAELIRQGNIHELSQSFAPNVEVTILDQEDVYSKVQAELILDKFFSQNKPRSVKMLHKVNSNPNYRFGVLILNSDKGTYRIAYTLKETDKNLMLIELRIETEKVK